MPDLTPSYGLPYPNDTDSLKAAVKDIPKALALAVESIVAALTGSPGPAYQAYTPGLSAETGALGAGNTATGEYAVIGRTVFWRATAVLTNVGTASNALRIGLPIPLGTNAHYLGGGRESQATGQFLGTFPGPAGFAHVVPVTGTTIIANGRTVQVSGHYKR